MDGTDKKPLGDVCNSAGDPNERMVAQLELGSNERVVWSGQPIPWRYSLEALSQFTFGAQWLVGGLFLCLFSFQIPAAADRVWPCLLPLLASVVGFAMMMKLPWRYLQARRIGYFITNHRAIVYYHVAQTVIESIRFDEHPEPTIVRHSIGSCDIVFATEVQRKREDQTDLEHDASMIRHGLIGIEKGAAAVNALRCVEETR